MTPEDKAFFESMYGGSTGGGSGSGGGAGTSGGSGCDAPAQVFATGCALAACHDSTSHQADLDLTVADPYTALVNKVPAPNMAGVTFCGDSGAVLINPDAPAQSLLYTKIAVTPPCGVGMPFPLGPMDNGVAANCVLSWIESKSMP